jgi:hypothetical protein
MTWMSVVAVGSTHDSSALAMTELGDILANPEHDLAKTNYWIAGDDAYKGNANQSQNLITPFGGVGLGQREDGFNFYQSSLRMTVECTFGELAKRWGILSSPLGIKLCRITTVLQAVCKLHNICKAYRVKCPPAMAMRTREETEKDMNRNPDGYPDWRVAAQYLDPSDLPRSHRHHVNQPLRETLADILDTNGMCRPTTSHFSYIGRNQNPAQQD